MVQGSGDVGIELVVYVREIGIGTVSAKLDALTMKELVVVGGVSQWIADGTSQLF